jgi:hypothetical protein
MTGVAGTASGDCWNVSSIVVASSIGTLGAAGEGNATATAISGGTFGSATAKLIVLGFTLTNRSYTYSLTGQLSANQFFGNAISAATARLATGNSPIFEVVSQPLGDSVILSETGTLPPGTYTFSVIVSAAAQGSLASTAASTSGANFNFALAPLLTPTPSPGPRPINLSTRMQVLSADHIGIGGFIIAGTVPKRMLLRAVGPSLAQFGITDVMGNPVMGLHGQINTIVNDNWKVRFEGTSQQAEIEATGIPPTNDLESAILATLAPGTYTAVVNGDNSASGLTLVELYDLDQSAQSKLANISTRAFVGTGANVVIGGFILGGHDGDTNIILRAIGPSLVGSGVPDALADPTLELRDSNGALVIRNDNWADDPSQAAIISAAGLAPTNALESGIAVTLSAGSYTAVLAGLNNGTGVGLVEIYHVGSH